ncbi:hypothetical protein Hanom_Chr11g01030601 [Helianthus anomalus]
MRACLVNQGKDSEFGWDKYVPKDSKVCLAEQDDEKMPEGFSWDNFCPDKEFMEKELSNAKAFVANASDEFWAEKYRKIREAEEENGEDMKKKKKKKGEKLKRRKRKDQKKFK